MSVYMFRIEFIRNRRQEVTILDVWFYRAAALKPLQVHVKGIDHANNWTRRVW